MTSDIRSHDVGRVLPDHEWRATDAYRTVAAYVATLPDAELIGDVLGVRVP